MSTRVLVIDDEPSIRVLVRMVLEEDGYTVLEAANGEKGLDVAEQESPHLVLLDIRLPGIDGWEVLRRLRDREPPPVVVMMSAHSSEPTLRRAEREGSSGYLIKPFRHVELLEIVATGTARFQP
ncbi:MAG: response regulator [Actinomycetota bacterium]